MAATNLYDVAVIGGGTAGVVAAVQAGRAGARTLLVERTSQLGGTLTNCGIAAPGLFHAHGRQVVAGIGWELVLRAAREAGTPLPDFRDASVPVWQHQPRLNAAAYAAVCDDAVLQAEVDLRLHTMLAALRRRRGGWQVTLCAREGLSAVSARMLVDCTGDATAARLAGAPVVSAEPCQPATLSCRLEGYDLATLDLPALDRAFAQAVAARELQPEDGCWRIDQPSVSHWLRCHGGNANHIRMDAAAATSQGRTALEVAGRRAVHRICQWLRRQPGLSGLVVAAIYPEVGVRETCRIDGESTVTLADYESGRVFDDAVCHAFYPIDWHGLASTDWQAWPLKPGIVPSVPRGALIPRGSRNLLAAGRILSSDRLANSALRVEATCMATGQAAGALAALAAAQNVAPLRVPMDDLRTLLRQHAAIVPEA